MYGVGNQGGSMNVFIVTVHCAEEENGFILGILGVGSSIEEAIKMVEQIDPVRPLERVADWKWRTNMVQYEHWVEVTEWTADKLGRDQSWSSTVPTS
jgi:hypothetical protein